MIILELDVALVCVLGRVDGQQCADGCRLGYAELSGAKQLGCVVVLVLDGDVDLCAGIVSAIEDPHVQEEAIVSLGRVLVVQWLKSMVDVVVSFVVVLPKTVNFMLCSPTLMEI